MDLFVSRPLWTLRLVLHTCQRAQRRQARCMIFLYIDAEQRIAAQVLKRVNISRYFKVPFPLHIGNDLKRGQIHFKPKLSFTRLPFLAVIDDNATHFISLRPETKARSAITINNNLFFIILLFLVYRLSSFCQLGELALF